MSFRIINSDEVGDDKTFTHYDISRLRTIKGIMEQISNHLKVGSERICFGLEGKNLFDRFLITGGVFSSIWHKTEAKDIDVYILAGDDPIAFDSMHFLDDAKTASFAAVKAARPSYILDSRICKKTFISKDIFNLFGPGEINLDHGMTNRSHIPINYIITSLKTPKELLGTFDMAHCQMSYRPSFIIEGQLTPSVVFSMRTFNAIKNRHIVKNPESVESIKQYRMQKLLQEGWKVNLEAQ